MKSILFLLPLFLMSLSGISQKVQKVVDTDTKYSKTSIEWESQKEMFEWASKKAEEEMWSDVDKSDMNAYIKTCKGGSLRLNVRRITIDAANLEWFTVIIKKNNVEVLRTQLSEDIPETPGSDELWWNLKSVPIKKLLVPPFDVYVIEAGGDPPKHQFTVN